MKKYILLLLSGLIFLSCNNKKDDTNTTPQREQSNPAENTGLSSEIKLLNSIKRIENLIASKKLSEALKQVKEAISKNPQNAKLYYLKGVILFNSGKPENSLKCFNKSFELKNESEDLYVNTTEVLFFLKKYDECRKMLEKGLAKYPGSSGLLYNLGGLELAENHPDKAIKAYSNAVLHNSKFAPAVLSLGELYFKTNKKEEALKMFEKLSRIKGFEAKGLIRHGYVILTGGDPEKAMKDFNKALEYEPENKLAWVFKTKVMIKLKQIDKLISDMENTIKKHPNNTELKMLFVSVLVRYTNTKSNIEKALSVLSGLTPETAAVHFLTTVSYIKLKNCSQAKKHLKIFKENFPNHKLFRKVSAFYKQYCK